MFMYNDVMVNYQQRVEHDYMDFYGDSFMSPMKLNTMSRVVHILEVRSLDVEVTVNCETGYGFSTAVVISTLLAALKNIDDGFIYNLARKKMESQMGFQVDDLIPGYVAKPTDVSYSMDGGTSWDFTIVASVCRGPVQKPNLVLIKQENKFGVLVLRLEYYSGVHKGYIEMDVDEDIMINGSQAMLQQAQELLWIRAYEKMPMLAPDLSYMRYTEGLLNGGKYHTGKYQAPKADPYFSGPLAQPAKKAYGGKDKRVDELPGVKEMVKHPVTGSRDTLERVIISLNDSYDWSREEIANWLETLDIDITFKTKEINEQD
ncbi:hypothetical protein SEA_STIGMA_104 [Streptomyces phage Stigma]|nr:hypothetical protein SEA_STIGMA_104 [Streptomyces phage Stigma]